jgi:hypothetical protein
MQASPRFAKQRQIITYRSQLSDGTASNAGVASHGDQPSHAIDIENDEIISFYRVDVHGHMVLRVDHDAKAAKSQDGRQAASLRPQPESALSILRVAANT